MENLNENNEILEEQNSEEVMPSPVLESSNEEETTAETIQNVTISDYDLGAFAGFGLLTASICVGLSLGVSTFIKILRSSM